MLGKVESILSLYYTFCQLYEYTFHKEDTQPTAVPKWMHTKNDKKELSKVICPYTFCAWIAVHKK